MSWWSRIENVWRGERVSREIEEEYASHLEEALESGRTAEEARRAFGPVLQRREESRDVKLFGWLDSLWADAVFGSRQLRKNRLASGAAILSLALAIGACTSAFRLIDAILLRPLPVKDPGNLYAVSFERPSVKNLPSTWDSCSYPMFQVWRNGLKGEAQSIATSYTQRNDLTYGADQEMEKAQVQYVSGEMFEFFGLRPARGRLLRGDDDLRPGAHPYAVLSFDYWTNRFSGDPQAVGRTFRMGKDIYEIVGIANQGFTGTEPGTVTDVFVPTMMRAGTVVSNNSFWLRTFVRPLAGTGIGVVRDRMHALYVAFEADRAKGFTDRPKGEAGQKAQEVVRVHRAAEGVSRMQGEYRSALWALGVLVALVLLIACFNVANLLAAQSSARAREMALRVSIGAGRARLVQLVLVESAMLATLASTLGAMFAWWGAPFVAAHINPADNPARLTMPVDWRLLAFGLALTFGVTLLFGLLPALRASAVKPVSALKGGDTPHIRLRMMHALIAAQVAFCCLVLFVAGLFVTTFDRISHRPLGFTAERLLTLETVTSQAQLPVYWNQVADSLRGVPGVESVAMSAWPLMSGTMSNNRIAINGAEPAKTLAFFLKVSPGWLDTMKIPLLEGNDLQPTDSDPGAAIVNETFARQYFPGEKVLGRSFETTYPKRTSYRIVGVARDAAYRDPKEATLPAVYVPLPAKDAKGVEQPIGGATFLVRTSTSNPLSLAAALRREVSRVRTQFRVSNIRTQVEIDDQNMIRERLLATLALFFAIVALLLAGVGLYGVFDYSVLMRRRELGIRIAIGARAPDIARRVTGDVLAMVAAGAAGGIVLGVISTRYVESLLFQVKPGSTSMLVAPAIVITAAAILAALPAVVRALRIDPVKMLRAE